MKSTSSSVTRIRTSWEYKFNATRDKYEPQGIPVEVMNLDDYGNVNGERILKRAIQLLKQNKQG